MNVLIVDDEKDIREILSLALVDMGYTVLEANNGVEALRIFKETQPGLVLTDIKMPGMDGTQVLKTLKENHKYLEIIMLTGHATIDSAVECTKMGAFKYLEKPYDFEKMVELIMEAYEARLKRKFENNQKRVEEIQKLSISSSPLGLLRALARLDDEEK